MLGHHGTTETFESHQARMAEYERFTLPIEGAVEALRALLDELDAVVREAYENFDYKTVVAALATWPLALATISGASMATRQSPSTYGASASTISTCASSLARARSSRASSR